MMLRRILMLLAFCASIFSAKAQSYGFEWANITNVKNISPGDVEFLMDNAGNLLLAGTFSDSMDIDPGPSFSYKLPTPGIGSDIFLQKQNSQGALLWSYTFGGFGNESLRGITVDSQDNIYLVGRFANTVDFDAGPGVSQLTATGLQANFILKLSPQGQFLWVRRIGENAVISGIAHDRKGSIYTCGAYQNTVDFNPGTATFNLTSPDDFSFFVQKLDTAGNFSWAKSFNNAASNTNGQSPLHARLTIDTGGNPCFTGFFRQTVDFDPGSGVSNLTANGTILLFVAKLDTLGGFLWAKKYANAAPFSCTTDRNNNIILVGEYEMPSDFDPGPAVVTLPATGTNNNYILKINASGDFEWVVDVSSNNYDIGRSVKADAAGNVYFVGYSRLNAANPLGIDFDPGPAVYTLPFIASSGVSYLYRLTPQGGFKSLQYLPSGASFYRMLAFNDSSNLYMLTLVTDSLDCNHGTGVYTLHEQWRFEAQAIGYSVIKLASCTGAGSASTVYDTACASLTSPSGRFNWTASGTYRDTLANANGCDSVITFNLTIYPVTHDTVQAQSCGPYLSPSGAHTWYTSGTYLDTLTSSHGCDSIITVQLTMQGASFHTVSEYVCRSYVSPSGRYTWAASGNYRDTLANVHGCDSILTINLTVHDTSVSPVPNGLGANSNVGTFQWLDCSNGYALIPGGTTEFLYPTQSGRYAVVVSHNGCVDTSGCHEFWALGMGGHNPAPVTIAPNPTKGQLTISLAESEAFVEATLTAVNGAVLWTGRYRNQKEWTMDLGPYAPGLYFLRLKTAADNRTLKISRE